MTMITRRRIFGACALALAVLALLLLSPTYRVDAAVAGPSPLATAGIDEGSDPDGGISPVYAVVEANGRYYIGGDFQTVAGESQPFLAAIEVATGRLDQTWRPQVNGLVNTIAVSPDGSAVYVGGKFNKINNSYPSRIAKLDPVTGAVDTNFDPDANAAVQTLTTDGTSIWAGGAFTSIGGVTQNNLVKLDASGVVDTNFLPVLDGKVLDLELANGQLYISGNFTTIDAVTHERIAALDPITGAPDAWSPSSAFKVYDVTLKPDGSILYAAGAGSLGAGGNSLTAWDTATGELLWRRINSGDFQAVVATDELVYIGTHGEYVYIDNDGPFLEDDANPNAVRRNKLAAFDPVTGALDAWNPGANSTWGVWTLGLGPSGLLVGGDFTTIGGVVQPHFAVFVGPSIGNKSPIPSFTYDCNGGTCTFDASASSDPDGTVAGYGWDFGDGQVATGANPSATFPTNARPNVALTVTDDGGATARTQNAVIVGDGLLDVQLVDTATANGQGATITPSIPSSVKNGDLAVAVISVNNPTATITAPAGWTLTGNQVAAGSMSSSVYTKPLTDGDAGTDATFTFDQSWKADASIVVFRDVDLAAPVVAVASAPESALWGQHGAPGVTTASAATTMHYWANRSGDGVSLASPGDEATIVRSVGTGGAHINATISLATSTGAGSIPERVAIGDLQTKSALGWTLAIAQSTAEPTCQAVLNADDTVNLSWSPPRRASSFIVRRNDSYLANNALSTSFVDDPGPGTYGYVIRAQISGASPIDLACTPQITIDVPPPMVQICSAVLNPDDTVTLSWDAIVGENAYSVRRNGSYIDFAGNALTYTDSPGEGAHDYIVRSKMGGVTTNTTCTPTITIDAPPPTVQTCSAVLNGDDTITLTWDAIAGEDAYSVRRNGSYLAQANDVLTFTDAPGAGTYDYIVRSKKGGITTNTTCTPTITIDAPPPTVQTCSAEVNGDGSITLTWDAIAGEDAYSVRRNGAWLENTGALTFTDVFAQGGDEYVIRSRLGGLTTNTDCE